MITVVARWESTQMSPPDEWRRWRRLKGSFKIQRFIFTPVQEGMDVYPIEQTDSMATALEIAGEGERAFLEPTGYNSMHELPQGDIVLIVGNAGKHNMEHAKVDETYSIHTPGRTHFFGTEAASIALAIRHGQ